MLVLRLVGFYYRSFNVSSSLIVTYMHSIVNLFKRGTAIQPLMVQYQETKGSKRKYVLSLKASILVELGGKKIWKCDCLKLLAEWLLHPLPWKCLKVVGNFKGLCEFVWRRFLLSVLQVNEQGDKFTFVEADLCAIF